MVAQDIEPSSIEREHWGIIGHGRAIEALRGAIARDSVAHAYLFAGAEGSGRSTLALRFAQALNCERRDASVAPGDPCRQCRACRKIERGVHPDVRRFDLTTQDEGAARDRSVSKNTALNIDTVRAIQAGITLRPFEGQWALTIVGDAESMRGDAASAFLKTLEEPPPFAIVVLVARDAGAVLPTIRSRCQVVELHPVERSRIERALVASGGLTSAEVRLLAAMARGRPGWAIAAAADPEFLPARKAEARARLALLDGAPVDRLDWAESMADRFRAGHRDEVVRELDAWVELWRDMLLVAAGCDQLANVPVEAEGLALRSRNMSIDRVHRALAKTREASQLLDRNVSPRLVLSAMVRSWTDAHLPKRSGPAGRARGEVRTYA